MIASVRSIVAAAQLALLGALLLVGGLVAVRRLTGGITVPLGAWPLGVTGAALAACCLTARWLGTRLSLSRVPAWHVYLTRFAPLAAGILLAVGVLLPATPLVGACALVALLAAEETWSLGRAGLGLSAARHSSEPDGLGLTDDESLDQRLVRRRTAEGEEVIVGQVRVRFAAGQRTAEGHVAFCPPLSRLPQVEFEAADGPAARIELGQVLPVGARFDVKLAQAATQVTAVAIRFTARASPAEAADRPGSAIRHPALDDRKGARAS